MGKSGMVVTRLTRGAYFDSVFLMRLQKRLLTHPKVSDAAAVMGTETNKGLMAEAALASEESRQAGPEDLIIAVRCEDRSEGERAIDEALQRLDEKTVTAAADYRPRSLETAVQLSPEAQWVSISVPGRFAANVAEEALKLDRNVFLFSDNVSLSDEVRLKDLALQRGRLLLGPDCGTAVLGGTGFGFANRVEKGSVGLIGSSGSGLQAMLCHLDSLGVGVSHAVGVGGRDLGPEVGGRATLQALKMLRDDASTEVVLLVSKPPEAEVARRIVRAAVTLGKPTIINFPGWAPPGRRVLDLHFACGLEDAVRLAARLAASKPAEQAQIPAPVGGERRFLRGLFAGGTLALETLRLLGALVSPLHSNLASAGSMVLPDPSTSEGHTILDMGEDQFMVGRLHPILDPELRNRRLLAEAADPEVATILLDVLLGDGAHPDPAGDLAEAVSRARALSDNSVEIVIVLIGSRHDPQDGQLQAQRLREAGAQVYGSFEAALDRVLQQLFHLNPDLGMAWESIQAPSIEGPVEVVNVGLEDFARSLREQGAQVTQVDWRPPAGGDQRLMDLLKRLKD